MRNKIYENRFFRFYTWMVGAKSIMGLFFTAFVFLYLFMGMIQGLTEGIQWASLDLLTAVEMIFASFIIGVSKQVILPHNKLTKINCILWLAVGLIDTLSFTLVFSWFSSYPIWCIVIFIIMIPVGMAMMLIHYKLEMNRETRRLNKQLEKFKSQNILSNTANKETEVNTNACH